MRKLREKIDAIDQKILQLLAERKKCILEIAEQKKEMNLPLKDEKREAEIMESLKTHAEELDLSIDFVENLFDQILEESRRLQA